MRYRVIFFTQGIKITCRGLECTIIRYNLGIAFFADHFYRPFVQTIFADHFCGPFLQTILADHFCRPFLQTIFCRPPLLYKTKTRQILEEPRLRVTTTRGITILITILWMTVIMIAIPLACS